MAFLRDLSIRSKLTLALIGICVVALLASASAVAVYEWQTYRDRAVRDLTVEAEMLVVVLGTGLEFDDRERAAENMLKLRAVPHIESAHLFDQRGEVFADYHRDPGTPFVPPTMGDGISINGNRIVLSRTLSNENGVIGRLVLTRDLSDLRTRTQRYLQFLGIVVLVLVGLSTLLALWLQRGISQPLIALAQVARHMTTEGRFPERVPVSSRDEVGQLSEAFNRMIDAVQRRETELRVSQERYALVVSGSNEGVWDWDLRSNEVSYSPRLLELLGYTPEDGWKSPEDLNSRLHPEDREPAMARIRAQLEERLPFDVEYRLRTKSGDYRWFRARGHGMWDEAGTPRRMAGSLADITDARRSNDLLRDTSTLAHVGGWEFDLVTRQVVWSDEAYRIHGLQPGASLTPENVLSHYPPESLETLKAAAKEGIETGATWAREVQVITAQGQQVWVRILAHARREEGSVRWLGGAIQNITDRRAAEEELRRSEERYRVLTESAHIGIILQQEGGVKYANPAAARMFGFGSPGEMVGQNHRTLAAPEYAADLESRVEAGQRGEILPLHPGWRAVHRQNRELWIQSSGTGITWEGRPAFLAFLTEVTEQRRAELALRESEELFAQFMRFLPGMVLMTDSEHRIVFLNEGFARAFGARAPQWLGQSLPEVLPDEYRTVMIERQQRVLEQERPTVTQESMPGQTGRIHLLMYRFPIQRSGRPTLVGTVAIDISDRVRAEEEAHRLNVELEQRVTERTEELKRRLLEFEQLNRGMVNLLEDVEDSRSRAEEAAQQAHLANAQLNSANKELESFSYSVSHDLRAPLRNVSGFVELLRRRLGGRLDEESTRFMSIISDETKRMGTLIDSLLSLSRIGRAEMRLLTVDPVRVVQSVKEGLRHETEGREIVWEIDPMPTVQADPELLRLVFQNLVGNAVKFTRSRNPARIEVGCAPAGSDGSEVVLFVRDNGAGFNMKYAHKLFGVFQRLHSTRQFEGTGIGLANVQRIIHRHGGRVWAEGEEGKGSSFFFSLPIRKNT